ncbi:MAG: hypothetical protein Q9190_000218 [Brigantiaea leucoxantha]
MDSRKCLGAAIAAGIPFPLLGVLFGELVDNLSSTECGSSGKSAAELQSGVNQKLTLVLYVTVANFLLVYLHTSCWSLFGERLVSRLRQRYFRSLLRQEVAFFDSLPPGEVSSRLTADIEIIRSGTSEKVGICISSFSYLAGAYVVAFVKHARLAGILMSLIPAYLVMAVAGGKYIGRYTGRMSDHISATISTASEALSNVALVKAFGANGRLETKFASSAAKARSEGMRKAFVAAVQTGSLFFIAYSANSLAFWQGSRAIAATDDGTSTTKGRTFTPVIGTIDFENVGFAYPSRPSLKVLDNVSLSFPSGRHTAIVGVSGSGKSTITGLISRLYDPLQGRILLDGHDIRDINVQFLRKHIGIVQQDDSLLHRSILETIAHGLVNSAGNLNEFYGDTLMSDSLFNLTKRVRDGANLEESITSEGPIVESIVNLVREAAGKANADEFISNLEYGYATLVGPNGSGLSGGQKQRLAFARALVKDPIILILDEATSSLDSTSEQEIQASLKEIKENKTTVSIAHRLSSIKDADKIIFLDKGEVIEQGTHMELLSQPAGVYSAMVQTQALQSTATQLATPPPCDVVLSPKSGSSLESCRGKRSSCPVRTVEPKDPEKYAPCRRPSDGKREDIGNRIGPRSTTIIQGLSALIRSKSLLVFIGILASVLAGGSYSGEAIIFGHTVGSLSPCQDSRSIISSGQLFGLLFLALAIITLFASFLSGVAFGLVSEKLLYKIRVLLFKTLFDKSVSWHSSGDRTPATLLAYIARDATALAGLTGAIVSTIVAIITNLITGILLTHIIAWKIAIVLVATLPLLLGSGFMRLRVLARLQARHQIAYATSIGITVEAVSCIKTVAALGLENDFYGIYNRSLRGPRNASYKAIGYANLWLSTAYSISNLVYALAYWWGSKLIIDGVYTQTQFFIVLPALLFSAQSCGQMFALAPDLSNARVASARILDLLESGPDNDPLRSRPQHETDIELGESKPSQDPSSGVQTGASVTFDNVRFSYPTQPQREVLCGLSLNMLPGNFYAFVGPSGAGKSTLISLIERFFDPTTGTIQVDGRNILDYEAENLRDEMALVPQESFLFDDTVRFNVALGARREVSDAEIKDACRLANIDDVVKALPQGYETRCGPAGDHFSGGQRQRLCIARALLRRPALLLLDESTSALDAESELQFQKTLDALLEKRNMTILAVAHRLHTIQKADKIFLIDGGKCIDEGTHAELLQRNASYRNNAQHQSLGTE